MIKAVIFDMDGVLEDSSNGIIAAKKAGMYTVGFDQHGEQDLSSADMIVNDFNENSRKNIFEFFKIIHIAPNGAEHEFNIKDKSPL